MEQQLITTEYPRTYRTPGRWFFVNVLFSLVLGTPGLGLCWLDIHLGDDGSIVLLGLGCILSLLGALPIIAALRAKVVLDADRIEMQGLFSRRSLPLSEIQGRRAVKDGNGWRTGSTWLIPRGVNNAEDTDNKITISNELRGNSALRQWIDSLPDLDAPERLASEGEILEGANSASEREERLRALAHIKILCRCLTVVAVIAAFWGMFFPNRPVILLLVVLPWLAVGIAKFSGGLVRLAVLSNNDMHAYLGVPVFLPGILILFAASLGEMPWKPMLGMTPQQGLTQGTWIWIGLGIVLGLCLLGAAVASDRSIRKNTAITVLLIPFFVEYGLVAVVAGDVFLDRSSSVVYTSKIVKRYEVHGRHATDWVTLAPWGAALGNKGDVCVDSSFYNSIRVGEPVCVELSPGSLHIPWFVLKRCR